jgi:hypothetical protein
MAGGGGAHRSPRSAQKEFDQSPAPRSTSRAPASSRMLGASNGSRITLLIPVPTPIGYIRRRQERGAAPRHGASPVTRKYIDGGHEDFLRCFDPCEGLTGVVPGLEKVSDRLLERGHAAEDTALNGAAWRSENQVSTRFIQLALVGMKCTLKRGRSASQAQRAGVMSVVVVEHQVARLSVGRASVPGGGGEHLDAASIDTRLDGR